jgi:FtsZ-binding cell division protein ZapB
MGTLEQVKLLETKVAKAIDYVNQLTGENAMLREKLGGYQTKIDELEVLIKQFKDDQGKVESGILSALDRLNQFEDAIEKGVSHSIPNENKPIPAPEKETAPQVEQILSEPVLAKQALSEPLSIDPLAENENTLFSETSPAEDSDDEAAIMAALEAEEKVALANAKAKSAEQSQASLDEASQGDASPGDASPEAELDIF